MFIYILLFLYWKCPLSFSHLWRPGSWKKMKMKEKWFTRVYLIHLKLLLLLSPCGGTRTFVVLEQKTDEGWCGPLCEASPAARSLFQWSPAGSPPCVRALFRASQFHHRSLSHPVWISLCFPSSFLDQSRSLVWESLELLVVSCNTQKKSRTFILFVAFEVKNFELHCLYERWNPKKVIFAIFDGFYLSCLDEMLHQQFS